MGRIPFDGDVAQWSFLVPVDESVPVHGEQCEKPHDDHHGGRRVADQPTEGELLSGLKLVGQYGNLFCHRYQGRMQMPGSDFLWCSAEFSENVLGQCGKVFGRELKDELG